MHIEVNTWLLTAFFLVFIRLSALFLLTPVFSITQMPLRVRNLLLLILGVTLVVSLQIVPADVPKTFAQLVEAAIHEFFVGATMAFSIQYVAKFEKTQ